MFVTSPQSDCGPENPMSHRLAVMDRGRVVDPLQITLCRIAGQRVGVGESCDPRARAGHPHCPTCGRPIERQTVQQALARAGGGCDDDGRETGAKGIMMTAASRSAVRPSPKVTTSIPSTRV